MVPMASAAFVQLHRIDSLNDIGRVPLIHSLRSVVTWEQWAARHAPGTPLHARSLQFDRAHLALAAAADGLGLVMESTLQAEG